MGPARRRLSAPAHVIDTEAIDEFIAVVGVEGTVQLLTTYLGETERRLAILHDLSVDQLEAIHLEAHTLKGSSGTFGLPRLAGMARGLERSAAAVTAQDHRARLQELDVVYAESKDQLVAYLEKILRDVAPVRQPAGTPTAGPISSCCSPTRS